jgi:hypothetical protein
MIQKEPSTPILGPILPVQVPAAWPEPAYAALRPLVVGLTALAAFAVAARIEASAKLTACLVAFENWSNAAVVAATVDFSAVTAMSEPAGAFFVAFSTHAATPLV